MWWNFVGRHKRTSVLLWKLWVTKKMWKRWRGIWSRHGKKGFMGQGLCSSCFVAFCLSNLLNVSLRKSTLFRMTKQGKSAPSHWILIWLNVLLKDCLVSCVNVSSCEKCFQSEAAVLAVSLLYPCQALIPALFIFVTKHLLYTSGLFWCLKITVWNS